MGEIGNGELTNIGQEDWIAVSLTANQAYEVTVTGLSYLSSVSIGTAAALAGDGTGASSLPSDEIFSGPPIRQNTYFMPSVSGTYYIDVSNSFGSPPISYAMSVTAVSADYTDNASHPGSVTVGGSAATGELTSIGQKDWIAVSLTANQAYEVTVTGLASFPVSIGTAAALAGDGTVATSVPSYRLFSVPSGFSVQQNIYFMPSVSGTYYIDVSDDFVAPPESYAVSVAAVSADYTDNASHPGSVTVGGSSAIGQLTNIGQKDWIAVSLTANQAYEVTVTGLTDGSVSIGTAAALAGDGTMASSLSSDELFSGPSTTPQNIYFMPSVSGTYYIDVSGDFVAPPESYEVSVAAVSADYTDNASHPGSVTVGGSAAIGQLTNIGQKDWIAVSLTANQAYEVTVTGNASVSISTAAALAGDGTVATSLTSGGVGSILYFMPSASGTYYIDVSGGFVTPPESYAVSVAAVSADYTDNASHPGSVTVGGKATTGELTNIGQKDWIAVSLTANQAYEVTVTGLSRDASVSIGTAAALAGDGTMASSELSGLFYPVPSTQQNIFFMPSVSGTYYIDVSDFVTTPPESYAVSVAAVTADHTDNASHPGTLTPGSRTISDLSGDGNTDILWRNTNGQVAAWLMNGTTPTSEKIVGSAPSSWSIAGVGDFNGDGKPDILWRNTNGQIAEWQMNGTTPTSEKVIGSLASSWSVAGVGDFNGDGDADILWRNTNGQVAEWQMNGTTPTSEKVIGSAPSSWSIAGVGDFNGDGDADILWRNTNGQVAEWQMDGTTPISETVIGSAASSWSIAGVGDFKGDGNADILWRNTDGQVDVWLMNGTTPISGKVIGSMASSWSIAGVGDFNGDGKSDILWRNTNGQVAEWLMNGTTPISEKVVGSAPSSWSIAMHSS
ncbi:MAG TPA: VCBS repeat-containing protein [Stellaceae bacterium]